MSGRTADTFSLPLIVDWRTVTAEQWRAVPVLKISNVVATSSLDNERIDPSEIADRLPGMLVDPRKFASGTVRTEDAAVLIFASGRVVCAGARSIADAQLAILDVIRALLDAGYYVHYRRFRVQNIVTYSAAEFAVDLDAIARACQTDVQYDRDRFPGARVRFRAMKIFITFFSAGSVIIGGARDERDARACWVWFYTNVLMRFRIDDANRPLTAAAFRQQLRERALTPADEMRVVRALSSSSTMTAKSSVSAEASMSTEASVSDEDKRVDLEQLFALALEDTNKELAAAAADASQRYVPFERTTVRDHERYAELIALEMAREYAEADARLAAERGEESDFAAFLDAYSLDDA